MKYKVSVIVPVYNVEKYLYRCLDTLVNQTLKEIEIIIIDDGSKDNCPTICDEYAKNYENVIVIHKENEGLGLARNTGINIANGEYIAFVDSDDYIDLDFYEKTYQNALQNNSDICFGETKFLNNRLITKQIMRNPYNKKKFVGEKINNYVLTNLLYNKISTGFIGFMATGVWQAIYKKEVFDTYKILFVSERKYISEDYIFHLEFIPRCKIITFVSGTYYYHCDDNMSLSRIYREDRFEKNKILYKEILDRVKNIKFNTNVIPGIYALFVKNTRHTLSMAYLNKKIIGRKNLKEIFNNICKDEFLQNAVSFTKETGIKVKAYNYCLANSKFEIYIFLQFLNKFFR